MAAGVDPADAAESMLRDCLQAGDGLATRLQDLRANDSAAARRAARLLELLDEVGFLHEPGERDPRLPERIGDYRVLSQLGRGGMGVVYLAEHVRLGRRVALKVIHRELAGTPRARARFEREALAASRLDHPGICTVYEVGSDGEQPFLAMRHVVGRDLAACLAQSARQQRTPVVLPGGSGGTAAVLHFVEKAANALHAAHEAGLVHRDVKPGNLMVTPAGEPVLLDFGLVLAEDSDAGALTLSGDRVGTPVYMAPEQVAGRRADRRTDVYALGVVLYECLTGEPPFREVNRESLFRVILQGDVPDPRRQHRAIGRDLWTVLQTALAKDPGRRYATAADLAEDLRRVREHLPIRAKRPGMVVRVQRFAQRNPAVATLLVGLSLVAVVLGWMWQQRGDALGQREAALTSAQAIELALRASDGREGPVPSLAQAIAGYEKEANVDTLSALHAASQRCTEVARLEHDSFPGGVLPSSLRFSPDSQLVLTPGWDGAGRLWNLQGERLGVMRHGSSVNTAVFSPDGRQILTASMDGSAAVWDLDCNLVLRLPHGAPVADSELAWIDPDQSHCVLWADWSPDGRVMATGCSDRKLRFWDPRTGQPVGEPLTHHQGPPMRHAWSRDGRLLASAECDAQVDIGLAPAHVLVYRTDPSHELVAAIEHPRAVFNVEFAPDGRSLLTACADGRVRIFALPGKDVLLDVHLGGLVTQADLSSDGERVLACSTNGVVGIWMRTGELLCRRRFDVATWAGFAADDRIIGYQGTNVVQLDGELREQRVHAGHSNQGAAVVMSPDGRFLASMTEDMTARIWSVVDPDMPRWCEHDARVAWVGEGPDGSLVSVADDGWVRIWSVGGRLLRRIPTDWGCYTDADLDASGTRLAAVALDGLVRIIDFEAGAVTSRLAVPGPRGRGGAVHWLPDGRLAVGAAGKLDIEVHTLWGGEKRNWSKATEGVVRTFATAAGRPWLLAAGWNGRVAVWRLDGTFVREIPSDQTSWFDALAWSPEGRLLAAGGGDRVIRLWRIDDEGSAAPLAESPLRGHDGYVLALAWSPDGKWLASGASDGSVRLWDAHTWRLFAVLRGHDRGSASNKVNAAVFTRDGRRLLTAGDDGAIQSWPVDADELLAIARRKVARVAGGTPSIRQYRELCRHGDLARAAAVGARIVDNAMVIRDHVALHQFAWEIVDPASPRTTRDLDLAERALRASLAMSPEPTADRLGTLARLLFWRGDHAGAVAEQRRAVASSDRPELRAALAEYEKLAAERH